MPALVTEHIADWALAIQKKSASGRGASKKIDLYGIKKLRELILELAVRGKLVPQDPSDEPASVLLEKVAAEKARLVQEKTIKKQKPLPPIGEDEKTFELPDGWACARLGELIHISSGDGLTAKKMNPDGGIPVFGGNGINGYHDQANVNKETLVIGRVGYYCGSIHITPDKAWVTDNAFITTFPEQLISMEYLALLLTATNLKENENATAQPVISGRKLYPIIVALPPKTEQRRVVTKANQLMALCDQLEQQTESSITAHATLVEILLNTLTASTSAEELQQNWNRVAEHFDTLFTTEESIDQLKQTILQLAVMGKLVPQNPNDEPASVLLERIAAEKAQLVKDKKIKKQKPLPPIGEDEKPFELSVGWEWCRISELLLGDTQNGISKKANEDEQGVPLLRISAATTRSDFVVDVSDFKLTSDITDVQLQQYALRKNDLLAVRFNGNKEFVGRTAVFSEDPSSLVVYPDKLIRMRFFNEYTNSLLMRYFINSQKIRDVLEEYCATTVGNWGISAKNLKTVPIPVPPHAEQQHILVKVDELMTICSRLKTKLQQHQQTRIHMTDAMVEQALA